MRNAHYLIYLATALALTLTLSAQPRTGPSTGTSTKGTYSLEMEIITPEQIEAYKRGDPLSEIVLKTGETLEELLSPKTTTPTYELVWTAITCGGGVSGGSGAMGDVEVEGSCGQPTTGTSTGSGYEVTPGIVRDTTGIFSDGFDSGDTSAWSSESSFSTAVE